MILLIDNYDSFSYNLVQFFGTVEPDIKVVRNDECTIDEIRAMKPTHIILSPGPGYPKDAGICEKVIGQLKGEFPILGVCLGHQAICEVFGAKICHAKQLMHGKQSVVTIDNENPIFMGLDKQIPVARYHSLIADLASMPDELQVIAKDENDEVMAVCHKKYPVYGLQFHPESILTPQGMTPGVTVMIKAALHKVINNEDLTYEEALETMKEIMTGEASQIQMAAFLTALRMKGETITEITACAKGMRAVGTHLQPKKEVLEIVGTGGDEVGTFNISTTSAFVIAAAGIPVAKHGNRSVSSKSGAADILEKLGVNLMLETDRAEEVLEETDMAFLFAQKYHSAMKNVGPVRKEMGERTIFNILGPLTNPANASRQLLGVYDKELVEKLAEVLANLGVTRGMSVCGGDGLDEITVTGPTYCCEIKDGELTSYEIIPEQFGLSTYPLAELVGGTPEENAQITKDILSGTLKGAKRDVVLMNAGIGIYLGSENLTMEEGIKKAEELINSGKAYEKMEEFVKATQQ